MMRSLDHLALRNLGEARTRTALSILVVMLGVSMMMATDGLSNSMRNALPGAETGQNMGAFMLTIINTLLVVVSVIIILAAGFLIFNAFLMSVTERRQQMGMLRSLGMTRRQLLRMVMVEGVLVGLAGTVLGMILGPLATRGLISALSNFSGAFFSAMGEITYTPQRVVLAAVLGMGITIIAVIVPAWNATRISPLSALRRQSASRIQHSSRKRAGIALIASLVLFAYLIIAPPGEWVTNPVDTQLAGLFIGIWLVSVVFLMPIMIESAGHLGRLVLGQRWKATGRLIGDNIERERQRVLLTVLTLAISLMMIIGITGINQFLFHSLLLDIMREKTPRSFYAVTPFDMNAGMSAFTQDGLQIPDGLADDTREILDGYGAVVDIPLVFVPELTAISPEMFSYVLSVEDVRSLDNFLMTFIEGDWETAGPIMREGCGVLTVPLVAAKQKVGIGDTLTVEGKDGPVECTIAGIGQIPGWLSIISDTERDAFEITPSIMLAIVPHIGVDNADVESRLNTVASQYENISITAFGEMVDTMSTMTNSMTSSMNAILVIAILAAALGIVNTTMMNVHERHFELGLIRSVGATRRQVRAVVMGEAALMGLVGALVGLLSGVGMVIIFVVTFGGNSFGVPDLPLWQTAFDVIRPAMVTGVVGLVAAPVIAALAAWLPTRSILSGPAIETLNPQR